MQVTMLGTLSGKQDARHDPGPRETQAVSGGQIWDLERPGSEFLLCSLVLCESQQNVYLSKPWFPGDGGSSCPKDCRKNEMK